MPLEVPSSSPDPAPMPPDFEPARGSAFSSFVSAVFMSLEIQAKRFFLTHLMARTMLSYIQPLTGRPRYRRYLAAAHAFIPRLIICEIIILAVTQSVCDGKFLPNSSGTTSISVAPSSRTCWISVTVYRPASDSCHLLARSVRDHVDPPGVDLSS